MELLTKKRIHEISVKELRKVAEIHRTTFYRHYQTPHDVLLEVEYDSIKGFQNSSGPLNDIADLKEHAARMCSYLSENRALVKPFIQNNPAIISKEDFNRVQEMKKQRSRKKTDGLEK